MTTDQTDPFAKFTLPSSMVEGLTIPINGTPAKIRVKLPSMFDDEFNTRMMVSVNAQPDDEGNIKIPALELNAARKTAFFESCIISAEGIPEGMSPREFLEKYPLIKRHVYSTAVEEATRIDEEVAEMEKKLKPTRSGKSSGKVDTTSMKKSSAQESA